MKHGRPTSYRPDYARRAGRLALLGLTDKQIADNLRVAESTFNLWKLRHPDFSESLKRNREDADNRVAKSLYRRACGYSHKAVKIFNSEGAPLIVPYIEHYPPDTVACIFWLKNRQSPNWRDKLVEMNLTQNVGLDISDTAMEIARRLAKERDHEAQAVPIKGNGARG